MRVCKTTVHENTTKTALKKPVQPLESLRHTKDPSISSEDCCRDDSAHLLHMHGRTFDADHAFVLPCLSLEGAHKTMNNLGLHLAVNDRVDNGAGTRLSWSGMRTLARWYKLPSV